MRQRLLNLLIAIDQLSYVLVTLGAGHPDETLSARAYRAHRDGKILGLVLMPVIDILFFWQGPDHCKNAYINEFARKNYPSEYRQGTPIFERRAP